MAVVYVNCPHCEEHIRVNLTVKDPKNLRGKVRTIPKKKPPISNTAEFWSEMVLWVIKNQPGISRKGILTEIDREDFTDRAYMNCITNMRRLGWIENRGTKKHPEWYIKNTTETSN